MLSRSVLSLLPFFSRLRNLSTNFRILNFFLDISWSREDLFEDFSELEKVEN